MKSLWRALSAELLKTKRTLAFWMTMVTPMVVCILQLLVLLRIDGPFSSDNIDAWRASTSNIFVIWCILALPLFITLETALLAQTEHSEKQWKHLFALAVPRWAYYAAKWLVGALLLLLGQVFLLTGTLLTGYLMRWIKPSLDFGPVAPVGWMLTILAEVYLISLLMLSIHTWVSLHYRSFTVAVGVGMAAAVSNIILINSKDAQHFFPWILTAHALPAMQDKGYLPVALAAGILGGLLLAIVGGWEVTRRDVL
jgi:lantibiotic transport system permease protein